MTESGDDERHVGGRRGVRLAALGHRRNRGRSPEGRWQQGFVVVGRRPATGMRRRCHGTVDGVHRRVSIAGQVGFGGGQHTRARADQLVPLIGLSQLGQVAVQLGLGERRCGHAARSRTVHHARLPSLVCEREERLQPSALPASYRRDPPCAFPTLTLRTTGAFQPRPRVIAQTTGAFRRRAGCAPVVAPRPAVRRAHRSRSGRRTRAPPRRIPRADRRPHAPSRRWPTRRR